MNVTVFANPRAALTNVLKNILSRMETPWLFATENTFAITDQLENCNISRSRCLFTCKENLHSEKWLIQ